MTGSVNSFRTPPVDPLTYIRNSMVDAEDDEDVSLHVASLSGDYFSLKKYLDEGDSPHRVNFRVRPFLATPLRLSVVAGNLECVMELLSHGAEVNLEDIKGQTPLFLATSLRRLNIMEILLKAGANPEGSLLNRGCPLMIAVRDGFVEGVRILLQYGARPEQVEFLTSCVPAWPLHHAVVYSHFSCFLALIQGGAAVDIATLYSLNEAVMRKLSLIPAIKKYSREYPEFVELFYEAGGKMDSKEYELQSHSVTQIEDSPAASAVKRLSVLKSIVEVSAAFSRFSH